MAAGLVTTIEAAIDFSVAWAEAAQELGAGPLPPSIAAPRCVHDLNSRLGRLWFSHSHPLVHVLDSTPPHVTTLFDVQDQILSPREYVADEAGVIPVVWENQGVYGYGFHPDALNGLLTTGDWCERSTVGWQPAEATVEDALVSALLGNFAMLGLGRVDDVDELAPRPTDANRLLWRHDAWSGFDGYWTNASCTLIHYSGMGLTVRRS